MKIGIVTTYRINNYGTKLQAYAMQMILNNNGDSAVIIDYYPAYDKRLHVLLIKSIRKIFNALKRMNPLKIHLSPNDKNGIEGSLKIRHQAINSFDRRYVLSKDIKGYSQLKQMVLEYDCFVCGSDQIWAEGNNITDFFNLNFVNKSKPTIAYAPSFGTDSIRYTLQRSYRYFLSNIDYLSVREHIGVELIKTLCNRDAVNVLDPTLIVDKQIWDDLSNQSCYNLPNVEYIFCYFLGSSPIHREAVKNLSKETGCKILNMPHMKGYCECDSILPGEKLFDVSPETFLKLIKNARYVCTDSFHGTVFSILFQRDFFTFERFNSISRSSTNSRIYSLLDRLGLNNRLITDDNIQGLSKHFPIDYKNTDRLLIKEKSYSLSFLQNSINEVKQKMN